MTTDPAQTDDQARHEAAVGMLRLLERLATTSGHPLGVETLKAAISSARHAPEASDPWEWLKAAGGRVGLRISPVTAPWSTARSYLATGPLLARSPSGWVFARGASASGIDVYLPGSDEERSLNGTELLDLVGATPGSDVAWGVAQPLAPAGPPSPDERTSPARRLLRLVEPDRRDVKILVVFAIFVGLLNLATPVAVEALVNTVAFVGLLQPIVVLALVLATCLGFAALLRALEAIVVELLQRRVFVRVATDLAYRLPRVSRQAMDAFHGPELVNRFFDVATVQKVGSKLLLDGVTALLSATIGLLVLAFYHPLLLAFDVVLLVSLLVIVFVLGRGAVKTAIKESSAKYAVADWLEEVVRHPLAFHLAGGREIALDHADTLANTYLERRGTHYKIVLRQLVSALGLQVLASTLLLGLGGWLVKIGELTLGQLVASWLIVSLVLSAVAKLGQQLESVYDLLAATDKLGVLFDLPLEREAGEEPPARAGPARLTLRDLSYSWPGRIPCFRNVELELQPGESAAILGPSGCGKSTLLETIQGQRPSSEGLIEFDGLEIRSLRLSSIRPQIGLGRSGEVISASVARNVRLGVPLPIDEVQRVLEVVGLWRTVERLSEGVETQLTSSGKPLSGGQADQLALARVLASKPRLLLIDGLLDSLDEATLDRVFEVLTRDPPWSLLVATRLPDVARRCERVFKLTEAGLEEDQ